MSSSSISRENIPLADIAQQVGTPVYVYDAAQIQQRYRAFDDAFAPYPHRVHYALKANSTLAIARLIRSLGAGADANSGGEIDLALRAGFAPRDIVFTGVGKSEAELTHALDVGVQAINAESRGELERLDSLSRSRGSRARVALRLNPDIVAGTHPHISTGQRSHKFGVPLESAREICVFAMGCDGLALVGLHVHIGSQLSDAAPIRASLSVVAALARDLMAAGATLEHIDVGGGLGISYDDAPTLGVEDYAGAVVDEVAPTGLSILTEPGRWIVGPAGVLLARVVDVKPQGGDRFFVVLDTGMSELLRPALYGAFHRVEPLAPRTGPPVVCDVVGPICETSDVIGAARSMSLPAIGDVMVIRDAGAYGASMASNYNRHPLPAEVIVEGEGWRVVRRRQTFDEMVALET